MHTFVPAHLVLYDRVDEVLLGDVEVDILRSARRVRPGRGEGVVEAPEDEEGEGRGGRGGGDKN